MQITTAGREALMPDRVRALPTTSHHAGVSRVDVHLSKRHGGRPATWAGRRKGREAVVPTLEKIVAAHIELGDLEGAVQLLAPLEAALSAAIGADGVDAVRIELEEQRWDMREDIAQTEYRLHPTPESYAKLRHARAMQRLWADRHDALLRAQGL